MSWVCLQFLRHVSEKSHSSCIRQLVFSFFHQCQYVQYGEDRGDGAFTPRGPGWEAEAPGAPGNVPNLTKNLLFTWMCVSDDGCSLHYVACAGARDGDAQAGSGGGAKKKGGTGETTAGGDQQETETCRERGEAQGETKITGTTDEKRLRSDVFFNHKLHVNTSWTK